MLLRKAIGETIREIRLGQGLTLRKTCKSGMVAIGYLSEIERGRKEASSEILEGIAFALGCSVSDLVFKAALKMAGLDIPDTPESLTIDEYADLG